MFGDTTTANRNNLSDKSVSDCEVKTFHSGAIEQKSIHLIKFIAKWGGDWAKTTTTTMTVTTANMPNEYNSVVWSSATHLFNLQRHSDNQCLQMPRAIKTAVWFLLFICFRKSQK